MWHSIDTNSCLSSFERSSCWGEDANTLEVVILERNEKYFPEDTSLSGYFHKNLHLLVEVDGSLGAYLHVVFIACEQFSSCFIDEPYFVGTVDSLKRVDVGHTNGRSDMRCARVIYRVVDESELPENGLFLASQIS